MYDFNIWSLTILINNKWYLFILFFLLTIALESAYYGKNCVVEPDFLASFSNHQRLSVGVVTIRVLSLDLIGEKNKSLIGQMNAEAEINEIDKEVAYIRSLRRRPNSKQSKEIMSLEERKQDLKRLVVALERIRPC